MSDEPHRIDPAARLREVREAVLPARPPAEAFGDDLAGDELADVRAEGMNGLRRQQWHLQIPSRFVWAELADFTDEPQHADLTEWAAKPDGRNLVLLGPVGTGKTHAAIASVRPAHFTGLEARFYPTVELLDGLRPGAPEPDRLDLYDLAQMDRLVLDDLGGEKATDWTAERLYALINRRWLEERPTVVTSNLEPPELADAIGERTYSRLVGDDAVVIRLSGRDRRRSG